jgi:hypothetical protein
MIIKRQNNIINTLDTSPVYTEEILPFLYKLKNLKHTFRIAG